MKLYVIGFGPGDLGNMTIKARQAVLESDVIAGYTTYISLLKKYFPEKEYYQTPMKQETKRCKWAIETALTGKTVALVSSGDSGIYGLASLVYEIANDLEALTIEVIPGVTAACSGGSVLGAPLTHDFAVISLSDLLTPWDVIEKKLKAAAMADFVLCLYNPSSHKRTDYLQRACDIILEYQRPDLVCGYVRNIGREEEQAVVLSLEELRNAKVDMFTTVYVGNSNTKLILGKMVTPRGYHV